MTIVQPDIPENASSPSASNNHSSLPPDSTGSMNSSIRGHNVFEAFQKRERVHAKRLKRSLENNLTLGFWVAGLILLVLGLLFFIGLNNYDQAIRMRSHSKQVMTVVADVLSTLKDAETGQRGYLLTGRDEYLDPYRLAKPHIAQDLATLKQLVQENPQQSQQVQQLVRLSDAKLSELQETIALRKMVGPAAATALVLTNRGKVLMDQSRALVGQMQTEEAGVIHQHDVNLSRNANIICVLFFVGSLLILTLFILMSRFIHREMAARQKAEVAQAEHARLLQEANQELEAFTYSVSHDLRSPLRSIDGFSQIVLSQYGEQLDESGRRRLGYIRENAQRMAVLIDDLLNLSRITRSELRDEPVNISEMVHRAIDELQAQEPMRVVDIQIQEGLVDRGDPHLLQIVISNLLSNAWKFTGKIEHPKIQVGQTVLNKQPVYFVKDNGAGFDMQYANKLFGAFQRLHQMDEFPGTGVGLTTVQRILHRHGGKIWPEAAIDQGATFYFTIHTVEPSLDKIFK